MELGSMFGDPQLPGDGFVAMPFGQHGQHLRLARTQGLGLRRGRGALGHQDRGIQVMDVMEAITLNRSEVYIVNTVLMPASS